VSSSARSTTTVAASPSWLIAQRQRRDHRALETNEAVRAPFVPGRGPVRRQPLGLWEGPVTVRVDFGGGRVAERVLAQELQSVVLNP